jgi:TolB-like protein/Tfp pilus assembly protein PilF
MNRVKHIEIDLNAYKIVLEFQNSKNPLVLHFDTPSRKFYLSLIALIVNEMKQPSHSGYVYIRKHEQLLKFFDDKLAGSYASGTIDGMWEKIRKAWHYSLPNLEEAAHFKIEGRDVKPPYEKGGKFVYECSEAESDSWAIFFGIDDITNKWRFRFAFDTAGISSTDVTFKFGKLRDGSAWKAFLKDLDTPLSEISPDTRSKSTSIVKTHKSHWQLYAVAAIVVILLLVGGATILNRYTRPAPKPVDAVITNRPSIAVLPFVNVSDDPDKDYFCDGITEELINSLARVKDLRVISRTSAFYFKDKSFDLRTIGEKLGVDNILEGSVRVSGDKLKISAQLIKVKDDSHLWAETYDLKMIDIFGTQENLAQEIICSLKSQLGCKEDDFSDKHATDNLDAYNLYLKGRYLKGNYEFKRAIDYYEQAVQEAPNYALAYTGIADANIYLGLLSRENFKGYYQNAKIAVSKALEIDDTLSEAHASNGFLKLQYEWDWDGAKASLKRAIDLNPGNSLAHLYYYHYLRLRGRFDDAMTELKLSLGLDPLSFQINHQYGLLLRNVDELDKALNQFNKTLELYPNHPATELWLGMCYLDKGDYENALILIEKAVNHPRVPRQFALGFQGYAYSLAGRSTEAYEILDAVLQEAKDGYFSPHLISLIYNGLGDEEKMFKYLEKAHMIRDPFQFTLKAIPMYEKFHSDPRFVSLLTRMGLEE